MKKKTIKAIRLLANRLPESYVLRKHSISIKGSEVRLQKIETDLPIDLDENYKISKNILERINHTQRLKRAYSKSGDKGVYDYMIWLNENNIRLNKRLAPKDQIDTLDAGLLGVLSKGVKGFWQNLIIFLFSFLTVFKKQTAQNVN